MRIVKLSKNHRLALEEFLSTLDSRTTYDYTRFGYRIKSPSETAVKILDEIATGNSVGYVIIDNIYEAFRQANLSIPSEGLSLRYISVNQQLFRLGESVASDHKQQTILDFIRIVEGKDSAIP